MHIAESLNRSEKNVGFRWARNLKPILLSYHYGTLHRPWKKVLFEYLIDRKIVARQDINYRELKPILPEQNAASIGLALTHYRCKTIPLWQLLKKSVPDLKDRQESERIKDYREKIVGIYESVKNCDST